MACGSVLWATSSTGQDTAAEELLLSYGDRSTVSIATGEPRPISRVPSVASVITADEIAAMGATDLDQVLETVPGLHVNRSANVYAPLYVIRGVVSQFTPQVLVLQNGLPITTLFVGNKGNLWSGYPVEHIARIEVIRGPGSALYGSDAFSGVINIITKAATDTPGTEVGGRYGSFATKDLWVQHGGHDGAVDVAAYLRLGRTDGFTSNIAKAAAGTSGPVNMGNDPVDGNLDLGYRKWRLRLGYKLRDHLETGAGIAQALDPVGRQKSERLTGDLSWVDPHVSSDWGLGFTAGYLQYAQLIPVDYQLFPPGTNFGSGTTADGFLGGPETRERQLRLSTFATYAGLAGHNLRFGLGHDDLNLYWTHETRNFTYAANGALIPTPGGVLVDFTETNPFLRPHRRMIDYLYAQDEWNFAPDWMLTAGLRHDRYSDFGSTTNPRLAVVWDAAVNVTAKLLYGRAFRAPAFVEAYGLGNPVALGQPNLRPETNRTLEAAVSWQARLDTQFTLSLFHYAMQNAIRTVPNTTVGTGSTYANTGGQNGHGGELEVLWSVSRTVRVTGNIAMQRSIDEVTGQDAGYAPHQHVYLRADWLVANNWQAGGQINRVADRKRASGDMRSPIPDYTTVDLTLKRSQISAHWDVTASVRNLFNASVLEPSLAPGTAIPGDLPMAPRSLYLQAVYRL
jgi:iron complex outermembrane receptor protein